MLSGENEKDKVVNGQKRIIQNSRQEIHHFENKRGKQFSLQLTVITSRPLDHGIGATVRLLSTIFSHPAHLL